MGGEVREGGEKGMNKEAKFWYKHKKEKAGKQK